MFRTTCMQVGTLCRRTSLLRNNRVVTGKAIFYILNIDKTFFAKLVYILSYAIQRDLIFFFHEFKTRKIGAFLK